MQLDFPRLIQDLAVNLQQPLMEPVEDACRISWDEVDMYIYLHEHEGQELVILSLEFGEIPRGMEEHLAVLMLQANYLWIASEYATLSLNPENQKLNLCDKLHSELVDVDKLTARVKQLYQTAVYWQDIIADESQKSPQTSPALNADSENDFAIKI